jgi:hypothetical protein
VSRGEIWFGRIFILPHTIIGIGALGYLMFLLAWRLFGTDIPGVVTGTETEAYSKGIHYRVKYSFRVGEETRVASEGVSQEVYERFDRQENDKPTVTVHYFALGSHEHHELREAGSLWGEIWRLAAWAGFWNTIIGLVSYQLWIAPIRLRQLYKYGEATPGTLVAKREKAGCSKTYYMTYSFRVNETGELLQAESEAENLAMWKMIPIGHPVTVLYARNNPKRSTVYELGGYGVLEE